MTHERRNSDLGRMAVGLVVLAAGFALLADRLDWIHIHHVGRLWPLILIAFGFTSTASAECRRKRRGGLILLFTGCWLLIASLGLFGLGYATAWPLSIVAVGLATILAPSPRHSASGGWFLVLLGGFLLAWTSRLADIDMETAWPLLLIAAGVFIILRAFDFRRGAHSTMEVNDGQQ